MAFKSMVAGAALSLLASVGFAATLTPADDGGTFDVLATGGYTFDEDFAFGTAAGSYSFTFENTTTTTAAVTLNVATVTQSTVHVGGDTVVFGAFTGGATVAWDGAGTVVDAAEGEPADGSITFTIGAGESDTLVLTWGESFTDVPSSGTPPNIDFTVNAIPVPLPAGALLLGTALVGLGVARRRKVAA